RSLPGPPSTRPPTASDSARECEARARQRDGGLNSVYASLPLTGAAGSLGREVLRGAELAHERSQQADVELIALDSGGDRREALALANARRAADDPRTPAYLGDFHSSQ